MKKNKTIYIVLTQNNTILARTIRFITGKKYTHCSITFSIKCNRMYSFGRKYFHNPFYGIFKIENISDPIFNYNAHNTMAIYSLEVTSKEYRQIRSNIKYIRRINRGYNTLGLILGLFNVRLKRKKYYCSEFVYEVINRKTHLLRQKNDAINPEDIIALNKRMVKVYEGNTRDYVRMIPQITM